MFNSLLIIYYIFISYFIISQLFSRAPQTRSSAVAKTFLDLLFCCLLSYFYRLWSFKRNQVWSGQPHRFGWLYGLFLMIIAYLLRPRDWTLASALKKSGDEWRFFYGAPAPHEIISQ